MVASNPDDRPSGADEVAKALSPYADRQDLIDLVAELFPNRVGSIFQADELPAVTDSPAVNRSRRRWFAAVIGMSIAAASAALWLPRSGIEKERWRTLKAVDGKLLFPPNDREATFDLRKDGRIEIQSKGISLLRLGQPLLGTFSFNVILHSRKSKRCGVFFASQRVGQQLSFHTIEVGHDQGSESQQTLMVWSRWKVDLSTQSEGAEAKRELLGSLAFEPMIGMSREQLQITCGRRSMPEVRINGDPLPHASWKLTGAGRLLQATPFAQQSNAFLGDLGLVNIGGRCLFEQPRLAYR